MYSIFRGDTATFSALCLLLTHKSVLILTLDFLLLPNSQQCMSQIYSVEPKPALKHSSPCS